MELGSVSKGFTAEAIYGLHQAGRIRLDDPITKYLPEAPAAWSNITVRHLLSHTSGIQNYLMDARFKAGSNGKIKSISVSACVVGKSGILLDRFTYSKKELVQIRWW